MSEHAEGPGGGNPRQPVEVTLAAVRAAGDSFGYSCYVGADRLLFPWGDHRVTAYLLGGHGILADTPQSLVLEGTLRRELDMSRMNQLATALNTWNQERLGPTLSFSLSDDGDVTLRTRCTVQIRVGLSAEQLADALNQAVETTGLAVLALVEDFPELEFPEGFIPGDPDTSDPRYDADQVALVDRLPGALPDAIDTEEEHYEKALGLFEYLDEPDVDEAPFENRNTAENETALSHFGGDHPSMSSRHRSPDPFDAGENLPYLVTLDRVRHVLEELGVSRTRGDDDVIVAWVNDVLFGFFLDNGPSYLVKGHWDPSLDPDRDFMRIFLLCNDWNESSINTKAFCHSDSDGLQVRVEFTAPIGEGLNDAQLSHNTAVAINQVLHALDSISSDAIGESVVHWPRRDES